MVHWCPRTLCLLMWKQLMVMIRRPCCTLTEFLLPILFLVLINYISEQETKEIPGKETNTIYSPASEKMLLMSLSEQTRLLYAPHNNFTQPLMNAAVKMLPTLDPSALQWATSEGQLLELVGGALENLTSSDALMGVVFSGQAAAGNANVDTPPRRLEYKIRTLLDHWSVPKPAVKDHPHDPVASISYTSSGFLAVQHAVELAFTALTVNKSTPHDTPLMVQQFPFPPYTTQKVQPGYYQPLLSLSLFLPAINVITAIMGDKMSGATELLKLTGISRGTLWLSWFLRCFVLCEWISALFVFVAFGFLGILPSSNLFLVLIFLTLVSAAYAMICCAITTLFNRGTLAIFCAVFLLLVFDMVCTKIDEQPFTKVWLYQMLMMIIPSRAMELGFRIINWLELTGSGLCWDMVSWTTPVGLVTMLDVLAMLLVQIGVFALLTWYLDAIWPGDFGVRQPWCFCLTCWWRLLCHNASFANSAPPVTSMPSYESVAERGLDVSIRAVNLRKTYPSGKVAVNGVNIDIYDNQITALLGHNGAGKTTTISMLTGMLSSSSGDVWVNGYNTRTDLRRVRESMGLCPQSNLLFKELTVRFHLVFFAMLKGLSRQAAKIEAQEMLQKLEMLDKSGVVAKKLSGGMKRKLSLGIAMIGGSRVVMLDEPTSGLDPESRRKVWDLLQSMRDQRTILLTTHYMEEADALADRIAIMYDGRIHCYGSPLFLKKRYGSGYELKLLLVPGADAEAIVKFVRGSLSSARVKSRRGAELSFTLPSEQKGSFASLFDAIEGAKARLGIVSISVAMASLEDVFIAVGKEAAGEGAERDEEDAVQRHVSELNVRRIQACPLKLQQFYALVIKKATYMWRNKIMFCIPVLLVILVMWLILWITNQLLTTFPPPRAAMLLSLSSFPRAPVYYGTADATAGNATNTTAAANATAVAAAAAFAADIEALVTAAGSEARAVDSVIEAILAAAKRSMAEYYSLLVAATSASSGDVALFSSDHEHSMPISLNLFNNVRLRRAANATDLVMIVTNDPFEKPQAFTASNMVFFGLIIGYLWALLLIPALLYPLAQLLALPVIERATGGKHLQLMTGITPLLYWLSLMLVDLLYYMAIATLVMLCMYLHDLADGFYVGSEEYGRLTLIFLVHGIAVLPYTYLYHYISDSALIVFNIYLICNSGMVVLADLAFLLLPWIQPYQDCLLVFPPYMLSKCFSNWVWVTLLNHRCSIMSSDAIRGHCAQHPDDSCCGDEDFQAAARVSYGTFTGMFFTKTGNELLYIMLLDGLGYFVLLVLLHIGFTARVFEFINGCCACSTVNPAMLDDDVRAEAERAAGDGAAEDALAVHGLVKLYGLCCCRKLAVHNIGFGVPRGECFGLLGVNGAGKTTSFRIMVGEIAATRGTDPRLVGYCPQFDAFCESQTGREVLYLFARLRGVHCFDLSDVVNHWLRVTGLTEYRDKLSGTYSGGNKRKLSTAIALVGNPPLLLLDEPTCGVDPVARRNIWKVLAAVQTRDTAIVLTSHSMDECEALCSRLAIMVDGQFRCLGSSLHLKHKFGQGFSVVVTLRRAQSDPAAVEAFKSAMRGTFPRAALTSENQGVLSFHLTDPGLHWGSIFSGMEGLKAKHANIEDFHASETSLEQVFMAFANRDIRRVP